MSEINNYYIIFIVLEIYYDCQISSYKKMFLTATMILSVDIYTIKCYPFII